jgi:hypothetical protein
MSLAQSSDAPGDGGRGRSQKPWLLRVTEAAGLSSRGSIECPRGRRVSVLPGAPPPALARGVAARAPDH